MNIKEEFYTIAGDAHTMSGLGLLLSMDFALTASHFSFLVPMLGVGTHGLNRFGISLYDLV